MASVVGLNMFHGAVGADKQCFVVIFSQISHTPLTDVKNVSAVDNTLGMCPLKINWVWSL